MKTCYPLYGMVPIVNTPFDDRLRIDTASLERMLEASIAAGISGCIVPAVASEVDKLSLAERKNLVAAVNSICGGRIQVVAGASADTFEETLEIARHSVRIGCAGVLSRIPQRLWRDRAAVVDYVRDLSAAGMPMLMIQDLDWAGPGLDLNTILELFDRIPAFRCLKVETVPAGVKYTEVLAATGGRLNVSGGWALPQMIEALDRGVHAFNTTAINKPFVRIFELHRCGQREEAGRLFDSIVPYLAWAHQHIDISIHFLKRYCKRRGWFSTIHVRPPITAFDSYHERIAGELIERVIRIEDELG